MPHHSPTAQPAYPLPRPADDPRFTIGLVVDIAAVLAEHGFAPVVEGGDLLRLQGALFGFLYAQQSQPPYVRQDVAQ